MLCGLVSESAGSLGVAEGGTRPVSSQPALQEVTVGPIVQFSLPHAAETQKYSFEESTPTSTFSCIHFQPCSPDLLEH